MVLNANVIVIDVNRIMIYQCIYIHCLGYTSETITSLRL